MVKPNSVLYDMRFPSFGVQFLWPWPDYLSVKFPEF